MTTAVSARIGFDPEQHRALVALLADLRCPEGYDGTTFAFMDVLTAALPIISHHLIRCGWRMDMSKRRIKARKVYGTGVLEGAVVWVPIDAPDDPLANVTRMSVAQIEALEPEDLRNEAKRRVGLAVPQPAPPEGWHTATRITISDEPDEEG